MSSIDELKCVSPPGPLELEPGEKVLRLDAWFFQPGALHGLRLVLSWRVSVDARFVIARERKLEGR
jgi:hypothetical protein